MQHEHFHTLHHRYGSLRVRVGYCQDIGAREEQQDALGILPGDDAHLVHAMGVVSVLCDGMGGMQMGREAGRMGVSAMLGSIISMPPDLPADETLRESARMANGMVYDMAVDNGVEGKTGCTLVSAIIKQDQLYWVSVGDSHIYLWHDGALKQLNEEHIFLMDLLRHAKKGLLSYEEAYSHPEREHLTSYLGTQELKKVDWNDEPVKLVPGDRVLLCSDGLFKTVDEEIIASYFQNQDQESIEALLVERVLEARRTGQDNVSVLVLYCDCKVDEKGENQQDA